MTKIQLENNKLMEDLKDRLNNCIGNLVGFNPEYSFDVNKEKGYSFYMKNNFKEGESEYNVSLRFKVYYEDDFSILNRCENKISYLSDDERNNIIRKNKDIKYIIIDWLGVSPKNTGMGTRIANCLLNNLKKVGKVEKVYLHPQDFSAKRFWFKVGFLNNKLTANKQFQSYNMVLDIK